MPIACRIARSCTKALSLPAAISSPAIADDEGLAAVGVDVRRHGAEPGHEGVGEDEAHAAWRASRGIVPQRPGATERGGGAGIDNPRAREPTRRSHPRHARCRPRRARRCRRSPTPNRCRSRRGATRSRSAMRGAPGRHRLRRDRLGQDHAAAEDRARARPRPRRRRQGPDRPHAAAAHRRQSAWPSASPQELNSPLGEVVGYKVRFQDRLQPGASVKLMTDGILLAETQTDPLLRAYDTLIIDEAHERSLNIDFLLGYLRQILPRRPDLKVIVTSATIDADRFAQHFAGAGGPAPVIQVSGRLFPVEQRWRPFEESSDYDLNDAIADAVDELWRERRGRRHPGLPARRARDPRGRRPPAQAPGSTQRAAAAVEILPLFARLSQAGAGPRVRAGNGRAHRAGHQRGRDLAHGAGHPLRHRQRAWRASSATATATRSSSCRSSRSARRRPTSAPAAAGAWPTASASGCTTRRTSPAGRASPTRRSCARRWPA